MADAKDINNLKVCCNLISKRDGNILKIMVIMFFLFLFLFSNRTSGKTETIDDENDFISGTITIKYRDTIIEPLKYVYVELSGSNNNIEYTTISYQYTDENGIYQFENYDLYNFYKINIKSKSYYVTEYDENTSIYNIEVSSFVFEDRVICHDYTVLMRYFDDLGNESLQLSRAGQSFQILEALVYSSLYYRSINGGPINTVTVIYEYLEDITNLSITSKSGCSYSRNENTINVKANRNSLYFSAIKIYESWDVFMHEYGHFVSREQNINSSPGGYHTFMSMCEHYSTCTSSSNCTCSKPSNPIDIKLYSNLLSWSEGFATFFGQMVKECYYNEMPSTSYIQKGFYKSYNGLDINLETLQSNFDICEDNELMIASVLYDMCDDYNRNEPFDVMSMSSHRLLNIIFDSYAKTFYEFYEYFHSLVYDENGTYDINNNISTIDWFNLSKILVGIDFITTIDSYSLNYDFCYIDWEDVNHTSNTSFIYDKSYKIKFYDGNHFYIGETEITSNNYIYLNDSLLETLYNISGNVYASIVTIENHSPITQYESNLTRIDLCIPYEFNNTISYDLTLSEDEKIWIHFTANSEGNYEFYSTGDIDTYCEIYNRIIVGVNSSEIITFDNNSGIDNNFRIIYHLNEGEDIYLRIKGAYPLTMGDFTFNINVITHTHNYTYRYESINSRNHRCYCICGDFITSIHVFRPSGNRNRCIHCGYVTSGEIIVNGDIIIMEDEDNE